MLSTAVIEYPPPRVRSGTSWAIQVLWGDAWVTVQFGFRSVDDAEWAIARWKQEHNCTGDPFRVYQTEV